MKFVHNVITRYKIISQDQYKTLNDAAANYQIKDLEKGTTKIWYAKETRNLGMGYDWCQKKNCLPDPKNLKKTHVLLGSIKGTDLDRIFYVMQGEIWSAKGEAYSLIKDSGLSHTSMSVGDVIEIGDKVHIIDRDGFEEL
jgi:hypothetical protein